MRTGRAPGRADAPDRIAGLDHLSFRNLDRREVTVTGREPIAVIDFNHQPVAALIARGRDPARRGGPRDITGLASEIDAGMKSILLDERIKPRAEAARQLRTRRRRTSE